MVFFLRGVSQTDPKVEALREEREERGLTEIFLYYQVFMLIFKSISKEPVHPPIALLPGIRLGDRSPGSRMNSESTGY